MKPLNPGEPRQVGRYRLIASLGEGGMGRVLLGFRKTAVLSLSQRPGVMDDCTITWTHRKIDEFTTEELEVRVVPQDEVADPGPMCRTAEEFAELVATKLPKP